MTMKVGMYSATHESVTMARGQRWENTDRVKNQSDARFVTVPSKETIKTVIGSDVCDIQSNVILGWGIALYAFGQSENG